MNDKLLLPALENATDNKIPGLSRFSRNRTNPDPHLWSLFANKMNKSSGILVLIPVF